MPKSIALVAVLLSLRNEAAGCSQTNLVLLNNVVYEFSLQFYPRNYLNSDNICNFEATAPVGQNIHVYCDTFDFPRDAQCSQARFYFSPSGNRSYGDASIYCGFWSYLALSTITNRIAMRFENNWFDQYLRRGAFSCSVATWPTETTSTTTTSTATSTSTSTTTLKTNPITSTSTSTTPKAPTTSFTTTPKVNLITTVATSTTTLLPSTRTPTSASAVSTPSTSAETSTTAPSLTVCDCGRKNVASRIVGGKEASVNEYPWIAGVRFVGNAAPYCGGALIDSQWILTASHCVEPFLNRDLEVVLGAHELGPNAQSGNRIVVTQKIIHENYNTTTVDNDIALLKLAQPVPFNRTISPVCLPFKFINNDFVGWMGTVTGWGTLTYQGNTPVSLNEVDVPVISSQTCRTLHPLPTVFTNNMFCTMEVGKDACQGDSGGPLTVTSEGRQYEIGVVSWGIECATPDKPGVYAKITNYLQWIEAKTGASFCKV